jgi:hypothetical protein
MSLRESPVRAHRRTRPPWLIVVLIAVGVLVVAGLGYGLVSLLRSDGAAASDAASATPTPCPTELVPLGDLVPAPGKVTVNVYNATSTSGLASKTATALEDQGFRVGKVANDPSGRAIEGVAEIRYGPKAEEAAQLVLAYVPGAELVALERKGPRVDLAVGAEFPGLADEAAVTATLASPTAAPGPAACAASPAP